MADIISLRDLLYPQVAGVHAFYSLVDGQIALYRVSARSDFPDLSLNGDTSNNHEREHLAKGTRFHTTSPPSI